MEIYTAKCSCGENYDEYFACEVVYTGEKLCPKCASFCINCKSYVKNHDILENRCVWCNEDY